MCKQLILSLKVRWLSIFSLLCLFFMHETHLSGDIARRDRTTQSKLKLKWIFWSKDIDTELSVWLSKGISRILGIMESLRCSEMFQVLLHYFEDRFASFSVDEPLNNYLTKISAPVTDSSGPLIWCKIVWFEWSWITHPDISFVRWHPKWFWQLLYSPPYCCSQANTGTLRSAFTVCCQL